MDYAGHTELCRCVKKPVDVCSHCRCVKNSVDMRTHIDWFLYTSTVSAIVGSDEVDRLTVRPSAGLRCGRRARREAGSRAVGAP